MKKIKNKKASLTDRKIVVIKTVYVTKTNSAAKLYSAISALGR